MGDCCMGALPGEGGTVTTLVITESDTPISDKRKSFAFREATSNGEHVPFSCRRREAEPKVSMFIITRPPTFA